MDKPKPSRARVPSRPEVMRKEALIRSAEEAASGSGVRGSTPTSEPSSREQSPTPSSQSSGESTGSTTVMFMRAAANKLFLHAKEQLEQSGNLKSTIKDGVLADLSALYDIVLKLSESKQTLQTQIEKMRSQAHQQMLTQEKDHTKRLVELNSVFTEKLTKKEAGPSPTEILAEIKSLRQIVVFDVLEGQKNQHQKCPALTNINQLKSELKEACEVMKNCAPAVPADNELLQEGIQSLKAALSDHKVQLETVMSTQGMSYAEVARKPVPPTQNHALIVSSLDQADTSATVLEKIRGAVDARSTGIRVDMVRRARDQKVVIGCRSQEEVQKLHNRLRNEARDLKVEEAKTKDPYVIIRDVLSYNTDEDVEKSLKTQNPHITGDIPEAEYRASVKYRRRARNPLESHIVLQVSPKLWQKLTTVGIVHVDLQRRPVADQSPLLQCTKCLGFGHGRRFCKVAADLCSHCGEPHLRKDCPAWTVGDVPSCRNCRIAKLDRHDHSAYDMECPTRRRWDSLARSSVAYC